MKFFGYDESSFMPCEVCGNRIVDVHHIRPKSLDSSKVNKIENLVGLCREHHDLAHANRSFNDSLDMIHRKKMLGVKTDHETERYL